MYKRNQVTEAIDATLNASSTGKGADARIRIKHLLDSDRANPPSAPGQPRAFHTGEAPGIGSEVWFSEYEVFALLIALVLMRHQWSHYTAMGILRRARPQLEPEHALILTKALAQLFDEAQINRNAQPGAVAWGSTDPVFLTVSSNSGTPIEQRDESPHAIGICRGEAELMRTQRERASAGLDSVTIVELTRPAWRLAHHLSQTVPKSRGRKSSSATKRSI